MAASMEFLRTYAGERSAFFTTAKEASTKVYVPRTACRTVAACLDSFVTYIQDGLLDGTSVVRQARADVVSDFLTQAAALLSSPKVHPAAAVAITGAALEEFLRNWVEDQDLKTGNRKPSLATYAELLRQRDLITAQDMKDITAWAGLRNHAAHGEWDEVKDKHRAQLMLDGINLFMRDHGARSDSA